MKSVFATTALVLALTSPLFAGNIEAPVVAPEVIVADTTTTSHAWIVPLMALIFVATAVQPK